MKKKIKVIEFISSLSPGGAESIVKDYACMMNRDEFDVHVMTTAGEAYSSIERTIVNSGIDIFYIGDTYKKWGTLGKVFCKLNRLNRIYDVIQQINPDIIHCHLGAVIYMAELCKRKKIKSRIVFTVHCELSRQLEAPGFKNAIDYLVQNNDMEIIALHERMKKELDNLYLRKHIVLNNGTDLSKYNLPSDTKTVKRSEFGIPNDAFVLGNIGRFIPVKNQVFLIDIIKNICSINSNSFLVLIGDGETKEECMNKVKQLNLENNVIFTGIRSDIPELLKMMDVFCLPSLTEGVPVTVIEAQAANIPCLIADHIVDDVVVTPLVTKMSLANEAGVWARAAIDCSEINSKFYDDKSLLEFDMNVVIKRLENYYKEILNGSK